MSTWRPLWMMGRMDLAASLLEISILLAGAALIGIVARRVGIPVTVVLALCGFLVAWAGGDKTLELVASLRGEAFKETVIYLFLPALVFEAAMASKSGPSVMLAPYPPGVTCSPIGAGRRV